MSTQPYTGENINSLISTVETSERAAWLEQRRRFIGGSDAASMFNEGNYSCHRALVWEKQGKQALPPTPDEASTMLRGTMLEPIVADLFVMDTGLRVRSQPSRMRCPSCGQRYTYTKYINETPACSNCGQPVCAGVNMDRQIYGVTIEDLNRVFGTEFPWFIERLKAMGDVPGPGYLEIKTANEFSFKSNDVDGMPAEYIFQTQHGLGVTDYKWGAYAVLAPTWFERRYFPYLRDDLLIEEDMRRTAETWRMVRGELPLPPRLPDDKNDACASCGFRRDCREEAYLVQLNRKLMAAKVVTPDDSLSEIVSDLVQIQIEAKRVEETEEVIKKKLKSILGDRQKVAVPSVGKRVDFADQSGGEKWDTKAIEAIVPTLPKEVQEALAKCKSKTPGNRPLVLRDLKMSEMAS